MPLLKFHLYKGRSTDELDGLLDVAHDVMVQTFGVPARIATKSSTSMPLPICERLT